jgi:hypothetical protein
MESKFADVLIRLALVTVSLAGFESVAHATDHFVDAVNGHDSDTGLAPDHAWKTITHAIDAGNTGTIHIAPGIYDAALGEVFPYVLMFHDDIQLVGDGGPDVTIIDGGGAPLLIRDTRFYHSGFPGQETALVGLTLRNAGTAILFGSSSFDIHLLCRNVRITRTTGFALMVTSSYQGPGSGGNVDGRFENVEVVDSRGAVSVSSSGNMNGTSAMNLRFVDCTFARNQSEGVRVTHGQGENASLLFIRSRITDNGRGGVLVQQTQESNTGGVADTQLQDCLVTRNAGPGVAVAYIGAWMPPYTNSSITTTILRCTIADNAGTGLDVATSAIDPARVHTAIGGSILYGNLVDVHDHALQPSITNPSFCDVGQGNFAGVNGNIALDPLFRDRASGDYRLVWSSPCVDVGDNGTFSNDALDVDGLARATDGNLDAQERADMGASEFQPLGLVGAVHVGGSLRLEQWGPAGGSATLFFVRGFPLPTPIATPFGDRDLGRARSLGTALVGSGPPAMRVLHIPNSPVDAGLNVTLQALSSSSVLSPPQAYTNAVTVTIAP